MIQTQPPSTISSQLAEFALALDPRNVPADVKHEAVRIFLDCVGCGVAGLVTDSGRIAVDLARHEHGPLEARVIGADKASLLPAVFANTALTNALDFEPVGPEGHVCVVTVPVALAVAEAVCASGSELLAAVLAGLEVGGRVGGAIRRPNQAGVKETPAVRGTAHAAFGAVAAAGRLLKLTPEQMTHAFGIAAYAASVPTLKKVFSGSHAPMTKYDHLASTARNSVEAALLAQRGFTGDAEVLEGEFGFWRFAGALGCDWDFLTRDLGTFWTTPQTWFKRYPVTLYTTVGIDVVRKIVRENAIPLDAIERIEVFTSRTSPVQMGRELRDSMDAWTSYAYNVAAGLAEVHPWRAWQQARYYEDPTLRRLAARVTIEKLPEDHLPSVGNYWEGWAPAAATVHAGGARYEDVVEGLPRMDDAELTAKFRENVAGLLAADNARTIESLSWSLESLDQAERIASLLKVSPAFQD